MDPEIIDKLKEKAKTRLETEKRFRKIDTSKLSRDEIEKAFHDLHVYQIELEVQNEELITAQSMLMELSDKYHYLYNYAPVGYLSIAMDGLVQEGNHTFADMVGVLPDVLLGKSIRNWIPREDSLIYYNHRKKLIDTRQPQTFSVHLIRKNKTLVPAQITLKLDDESHPTQILMIAVDETDIKNLEDAHKNLVNNSAQGMWLFREEQLVFANRRACDILGCSVGEFLGYNARDLLPMIDEAHWKDFLTFFEGNNKDSLPENPLLIRFKYNNRKIWLELYATQSNFKGQPALQFTFVDVTQRILANELIKKSEQKFKLAAELASDSIYIVNADSGKARVLSAGNYLEDYNWSMEDYTVESLLEIIDDAFKERVSKSTEGLYKYGKKYSEVYKLNLPSGKKIVIHDRAAVLEWEDDKPKTILGVTTDLTKIKDTEEKLHELNATKDKFFGIIAHDLKNPFNSILGFTEILNDDYDDFSDQERREIIGKLQISAENAFKLLDNLLNWSRIQTNRLEQKPAQMKLHEGLKNTFDLVSSAAEQKGIDLQIAIPDSISVFVDPDILESIVRNLLTNAIKFTARGGKVELSVDHEKDGKVKICVKDSGIGMTEAEVGKLFNIGEKSGKRGTEGEKGTGLGIILCREFVEISGGKIWVNSQPGKGTEFCFTLPAKDMK